MSCQSWALVIVDTSYPLDLTLKQKSISLQLCGNAFGLKGICFITSFLTMNAFGKKSISAIVSGMDDSLILIPVNRYLGSPNPLSLLPAHQTLFLSLYQSINGPATPSLELAWKAPTKCFIQFGSKILSSSI